MLANNIKILSTRELKREILDEALLQHIEVETHSFIKVIPDISPEMMVNIQSLAQKQATVVFTSNNAVNAVKSILQVNPSWNIFCIGGITKDRLIETFTRSAIIATAKNGKLLAEKICQRQGLKEVAFFCGNQRMNDLPEMLKAANIKVNEMVVYRTIETAKAVTKNYQGILFFSPSAVSSFFSVNTMPGQTVLFSIGETTTAAIESFCGNKVITSQWPGESNILELVTNYFK